MKFLFLALSLCISFVNYAAAQQWPVKPIKLVVPYPSDGNVDSAARIIAAQLQLALAQTVIVENKAGASGLIANEFVAGCNKKSAKV